ncbi:MAG TPA: sugar ABC transporter permease, partial [Spirochaetia bacterium]|nr:sugar ABC transporter permease [Spirochaetia bacterium]
MATQSQMIRRQAVEGWIFILPILIGTIVFSFFPVGYSLLASFSKWDGIHPPQFIGLQNYIKLVVGDKYFLLAVKNT